MDGIAAIGAWLAVGAALGAASDYVASRWYLRDGVFVVGRLTILIGALLGPLAAAILPTAMFVGWFTDVVLRADESTERRRTAKRKRKGGSA